MHTTAAAQPTAHVAITTTALKQTQTNPDIQTVLDIKSQGNDLFKDKNYQAAIESYESALKQFESLTTAAQQSHSIAKSDILSNCGKAHECLSDSRSAEDYFRRALVLRIGALKAEPRNVELLKKAIDTTHRVMMLTSDKLEKIHFAQALWKHMKAASINLNKAHRQIIRSNGAPNNLTAKRLRDAYHSLEIAYTNTTGSELRTKGQRTAFYTFTQNYFTDAMYDKVEVRKVEGEVTARGEHSYKIVTALLKRYFDKETYNLIKAEYDAALEAYNPPAQMGVFATQDLPPGSRLYYVGHRVKAGELSPLSKQRSHKMVFDDGISLIGSETQQHTALCGSMVNDALDVHAWTLLQLTTDDAERNAKLAVIFALAYLNQDTKPNMMSDASSRPFSLVSGVDVKKGDQLFLEYSPAYWLQNMKNRTYEHRGSIAKRQVYRVALRNFFTSKRPEQLFKKDLLAKQAFLNTFLRDIKSAEAHFKGDDFDSLCQKATQVDFSTSNEMLKTMQDNFFRAYFEGKVTFKQPLSRELLTSLFVPSLQDNDAAADPQTGPYTQKVINAVRSDEAFQQAYDRYVEALQNQAITEVLTTDLENKALTAIVKHIDVQRQEARYNGDLDFVRALCEADVIQVGSLTPEQSCAFFTDFGIKSPEFL